MQQGGNVRKVAVRDTRCLRVIALALVLVPALLVWATPASATFPGTNGKIAFTGTDGLIHTMNADGTGVTSATSGSRCAGASACDGDPVWSPDGTKIAFDESGSIYVVNGDGSGERSVTQPQQVNPVSDWMPTWSADGSEIAYSKFVFPTAQPVSTNIYKSDAYGLFETRLTNYIGYDVWPDWSPDGQKIAFDRIASSPNEVITVMNADGSSVTSLGVSGAEPSWAPDGRKLAFAGPSGIYVMNADGSNVVQLTANNNDGSPAWSPDGSKIAFTSNRGTGAGIFVMSADGTGITQLTGSGNAPDWQALTPCTRIDATPHVLVTANHDFVLITLAPADRPGPPPTAIAVTGVTQDEPVTGPGDGTSPDAARALRPDQVYVRAERDPQGDGRVYRIAYTALDGSGRSCPGTATVEVPRTGSTAIDSAPPSYNSFGP